MRAGTTPPSGGDTDPARGDFTGHSARGADPVGTARGARRSGPGGRTGPARPARPARQGDRTAARPAATRGTAARPAASVAVVLAVVLTALLAGGCGGRATTHHKPGTTHQEATGSSGTLLAAKDESGHRLREVPATGAPAVRVEARPDSEGGWNIHLTVERFRFTPESVGGAAIPGRGHARLLVDGRETARLYGPWHHVPAGARTLTVRLHADDHTVWAVAGKPVEATLRPGAAAAPTPAPAPTAASSAPSPSPTADPGRTVAITVTGTSVRPRPSRIELKKGDRLTLRVTADRADTLHVHGYDRELALQPGRPGTISLTVDRTGLFDVETHESGLVLTQLVVR
ncbi:hypothetical protein [Streptomyces sp. NPDC048338]|uniref:hypothetical protein n=1 Tax=Streptomyces sp. NPDC048338 TaxID=3365536 RepID=UPI00371B3A39